MRDVLVTGASGGIGAAVASVLASSGHRVIAVGRDSDSLERLSSDGTRVISADLARVGELQATVQEIDHLDALIHCAGVSAVASVADTDPTTWHDMLTVNVMAAAELTRALLPALRRSHGHVIFVKASPGMRAVPRWAAFVGSKAALRELADSLRLEEAGHGVRVTTVYPAATATERLRRIRAAFDRPYDPARCIQPDSLAKMIAWVLAAPADSYVTELSVLPTPNPAGASQELRTGGGDLRLLGSPASMASMASMQGAP
jgi:NADP-dependent 3-hydroxy acid dehydrogenase YdfG